MSQAFDVSSLTIIYAEDEIVFREIAIPSLVKAGIVRENILLASDGHEALDHLKNVQDGPPQPLMMLLDICMPGMGGNECAEEVQRMVAQQALRREPYMVCCSAGVKKVGIGDEAGLFSLTVPKPFGKAELELCLKHLEERWKGGLCARGRASAPPVDLKAIEVIVADDEPICRMAVVTNLGLVGADSGLVHEVEDDEEALETVTEVQNGDPSRPLVVLISNPSWLATMQKADLGKRKPFFVCTSVDGCPKNGDGFQAQLPSKHTQADLRIIFEQAWMAFHLA